MNRMDDRPLLQSIFHAYLNTKGEIQKIVQAFKTFH